MANSSDSINFRVHSVRDMEEENRVLKKDNFNMKLKMFHLKEKIRLMKKKPTNLTQDAEYDGFKKDIELPENAILMQELHEKNLLCDQARSIIEMLEIQNSENNAKVQEQQKLIFEQNVLIENLNDTIQELKYDSIFGCQISDKEIQTDEHRPTENEESMTAQIAEEVSKLKEENQLQRLKNDELKEKHEKLSKEINDLSSENSKLRDNLDECKTSLEQQELKNEQMTKDFCNDKIKKLGQLTDEMKTLGRLNEELVKKCMKLEETNLEYKKRHLDQSNVIKSLNQTIAHNDIEMRKFAEAFNSMKSNKQDDSVKTDSLRNPSSSSLPIKKSNKIINFTQKSKPKASEINENESGGLEKLGDSEGNCMWNPLLGKDYLMKFPK